MKHYHIQWNDSKLDWKAFQTEEAAEKAAQQLKRPGERYSIVVQDSHCPRCAQMRRKEA